MPSCAKPRLVTMEIPGSRFGGRGLSDGRCKQSVAQIKTSYAIGRTESLYCNRKWAFGGAVGRQMSLLMCLYDRFCDGVHGRYLIRLSFAHALAFGAPGR